jgi:subtilisin-like proprotein convertase family protein
MRWRPIAWLCLSVLCFLAALYFWHLGDQWAARKISTQAVTNPQIHQSTNPTSSRPPAPPLVSPAQGGNLNVPSGSTPLTNQVSRFTGLRLSNTSASLAELQRSPTAILLENALVDTAQKANLAIPDHLRAKGDPGTYIVQASGPIDNSFRTVLRNAGASVVSYIPNNAYLVRASSAIADQLATGPRVQLVFPYEPYFKLKGSLLQRAVAHQAIPDNAPLNLLLFSDSNDETKTKLNDLGFQVLATDRSPFGPVVTVLRDANNPAGPAAIDALPVLAGLSGVQEMEWSMQRVSANDLSRAATSVATDPLVTTNYLNLTGTNILVNVNDSGIDATHPDLAPRVFSPLTNGLRDVNGHGTHVAGTIASSGGQSSTVTNASGPSGPYGGTNNQFRGMAPNASLYSLPIGLFTGPFQQGTLAWPSDTYLQETPAETNVFISNNSWNYVGPGAQSYDLHAASYDAAVRDALPFVSGSQPLLFVFAAGNAGGGNDAGTGGNPDSIESPATAKNVITVGAIEQLRNITNRVAKCETFNGSTSCNTNQPWLAMTDSGNQVAGFSSRGNVGVGIEGQFGRFKPDVVAPGTFVISTKSSQWDTNAYYNPTSHIFGLYQFLIVDTNDLWRNSIFVPGNAVQLNISVFPNTNSPVPLPDIPIYVRQADLPSNPPPAFDFVGTNSVSLPPDHPLNPVGVSWFYALGNNSGKQLSLDLLTDIVVTNDLGDYLQVLAGMNDSLGPFYRYESGTSMAAADVSGNLALMQEFFQQRLGRTNSPALMKALLINGSRSVGDLYDLNTRAAVNFQGWGLIHLPTSIPGALTNVSANTNSIFILDQSPGNSLATGDSRTFKLSLTPDAQNQPLRVTLVWTDPPGNPIASIKLVNDLDLILTNLDDTNLVYFGNDFPAGHEDSSEAWDTNGPPKLDVVNNVENVFLSPNFGQNSRLATNYSITVVGRRVNVNAVTAQTNNVVQDYALVISCGDGLVTNALSFNTNAGIVSVTQPLVTTVSNVFGASSSNFSGGVLLNQHVGANTPLLGTNLVAIVNDANAVLTTGITNQWHFYVISNVNGFTNAAFLTFLPPTLSIPRIGVYSGTEDNSTRPEADIDLFVAPPSIPNNWALTNLDTNVLAAATKSLTRGGTETIVLSNATPGTYYIGVKSEDQMAAEYGFMGVFSRFPFGSSDQNGNQTLIGFPAPAPIPDGSPEMAGVAYVFAIAAQPIMVRRVIVTNTIAHELMSDLLGNLSHNRQFAVLNNHTCAIDPLSGGCQTCTTFIYDDSSEMNVGAGFTICPAHVQHTDGPGSLNNFAGFDGTGQWMLTMSDNATNHVGTNVLLELFLERQPDLTVGHGVTFTLQPGACRNDFVQVPVTATCLSVTAAVVTATGPVAFSVTVCPLGGTACKTVVVTNSIGGGVTIDLNDIPPLLPGTTYSVRTCNLSFTPITLNLRASFCFSLNTVIPVLRANALTPVNLLDNAVTDVYLTNFDCATISSLDVGLLINSPRISDQAITLIAPDGTRVLLFENRGGTSTNGLGTFNLVTNYLYLPFFTNNFDLAPVGLYYPGAMFLGLSVLSNSVQVLDDYTCQCLSNHIVALMGGSVSNTIPTTNSVPLTNANPYSLSFNVTHAPGIEGMVTWWPLDTNGMDVVSGLDGLFLGDVAFSTGPSNAFFDDFNGPALNPIWQTGLPNTGNGAGPTPVETYIGPPNFSFTTVGTNTVIRLSNTLGAQQRVGWRSGTIFKGQTFQYEVRFNTLTQAARSAPGGFLELWIMDAANSNRYDIVSPFGGAPGSTNFLLAGSSLENAYNALPFDYQDNTWYRLVIAAVPNQGVRASILSDTGAELVGASFLHGAAAFPSGFRIGLAQFVSTAVLPTSLDVAIDWASLKAGLFGEVNQAYFGDGIATRMIVPRCPELDLGLGRGFTIEGWINPTPNLASPAIYDATVSFATNINPNGAWRYAWSDGLLAPLKLFPRASQPAINNGLEVGWDDPVNSLLFAPSVAVNTGGNYNDGNVTFLAGVMLLNPGGINGTAYAHAIWTAPQKGQYTLNSRFFAQQNLINVDVHVLVNGISIFDSTITQNPASVPFITTLRLFGGDTVDFAVGPNGNFTPHPGNTGLEAALELAPPNTPAPLVEWDDPTNRFPQGVQFWLSGLPGTNVAVGSLWANIWDTNLQAHIINTVTNAITNGGWQHVALTYDTNLHSAVIYTNGQPAATVQFPKSFVPRTYADVYLGYHTDVTTNKLGYAGGLDEFSLYNRALSPCEVNAIYHAGTRGKYGTNVLLCPVVTEVTLLNTTLGNQTFLFTNGASWFTNGPFWETNVITFSTPSTNPTPIIVRGRDPYTNNVLNTNSLYPANNLNVAVDNFVLSELVPQSFNGLMHFTEDTNLATIPIKFAPAPFTASNFLPVQIFSNSFALAAQGLYQTGSTIAGSANGPAIGNRVWTVTNGPVTVLSNAFLDATFTNCLALSTGAVQCLLPTAPGHRYQLSYSLRGPCAVSWWNGSLDPLSQRAQDLISGNNGAMLNGATNTTANYLGNTALAYVGLNGLFFSGQSEPLIGDPDIWPEDIDDPAGQIELGDPPQLQLTNAFTIEAWINPALPTNATMCGTEMIFFRGYPEPLDCNGVGDPYWLALQPSSDGNLMHRDIQFHIADAHTGTRGADVLATNGPIQIGGGTNDGWWHIAAVFDKPYTNLVVTNGANVITLSTNALRLYVNGVCIASNYTTISPYAGLDPALSPGTTIGSRCRFDWTEPFSGLMDEVTVYARALTDPEIAAIVAAGAGGQADLTVPAFLSLAKLGVDVDGINLATSYGDNSRWNTYTVQFTAIRTNAAVTLQSLLPGTLVDGITLTELPPELFYLPEVSLATLYGKQACGVWTLELWDSRVGPTNGTAQLMEWQLSFSLGPSNPPPVITLEHGITYTNTLPRGGIQYFIVPVPQWATNATNVLQFANQSGTANPLPVTVLYNPTNFPNRLTPPDLALIGPASTGVRTLTTNVTPAIVPGQNYYLAVTNPNPVAATFALGVGFDITTLTNCQMLVSNVVGPAGIPRYFQFDVPTNSAPQGLPPQAVSFWLSGAPCGLTVVLSQHLPLPDLDHFDYISQAPCTNDQIVMLVTNSTPFPIQTNRWYVGVFNSTASNATFSAQACYATNYPQVIELTNRIPFIVSSVASSFAAPPGPPQRLFYDFVITNSVSGVLFEMYNLSGDADLVLQRGEPPDRAPYFEGSFFTGTAPEQIVLRPNADVPDLRGVWYLGVYNNERTNVAYTLRAVLPDANGLLVSAQPLRVGLSVLPPPHGLLLSWNSVIGERYIIQFSASLGSSTTWTNLGSVVATTPLTTFEVVPIPPGGGFFRVVQVFSFQPTLTIQLWPTNLVRIAWSVGFPGYTLQSKGGLVGGTWVNVTSGNSAIPPATGIFTIGAEYVVFDPLGPVPKFYRLIK